jgi:transcriptional regulator with XRE-family HTH domain
VVKASRTVRAKPKHGRGTGIPHPVDVHVGKRIRVRRLLLGMNQETLADGLGIRFQQVQKYESGANRISVSRLWDTAKILGVTILYFFPDPTAANTEASAEDAARREQFERPETIELIRLYYAIPYPRVRDQFREMVKVVAAPSEI